MQRIVFDCERMKYSNTGLFHYCLNLGKYLKQNLNRYWEELVFYSPDNARENLGLDALHIRQHSLQKFYMPRFAAWIYGIALIRIQIMFQDAIAG